MKKVILSVVALFFFSFSAFAQNSDNPGYFDSPGFVAVGGGTLYPYGNTHGDSEIRPFVTGMWNVIRSEYGFIGLSVSAIITTPYRNYNNGAIKYKVSTQQYIGDFSLNYVTGSKTVNFWIGMGYNLNYAVSQARNMETAGAFIVRKSNFEKTFYQTVYGYQYQIGLEYILTKNGGWGLYFLIRGQYTSRAQFDIDERVTFSDGTNRYISERRTMDLSNRSYTFGMTYHF